MKRKILLLFMSVVLVAALSVSYVSAKSPLEISKYDITKTTIGAQMAQKAAQSWEDQGGKFDPENVKVYEISPGEYLVTSGSANVELKPVQQPDGSVKLEPTMTIAVSASDSPSTDSLLGTEDVSPASDSPSTSSLLETEGVSPMAAPYWGLVDYGCWYVEGFMGWISHCCHGYALMGDPDPNNDFLLLEHFATAKSKYWFWRLRRATIECVKNPSSSPMAWFDYQPRSDQKRGQCETISLGISAFGVTLSGSWIICKEGWDITYYPTEPGRFKNMWYGSADRSEREVAYMVSVTVPQGGTGVWNLDASYNCW